MTKVDFAITYCCENLHLAMIKREWWFKIDTDSAKVTLSDEDDLEERFTCPYCNRSMDDVVDVSIEGNNSNIL